MMMLFHFAAFLIFLNVCSCQGGFSKIMVVGGITTSDIDSVEVIDLKSESSKCSQIQNYPREMRGGVGGLIDNKTPLVCGGTNLDLCFYYLKKTWVAAPSLTMIRHHSAGLQILNNSKKFMISGNYGGRANTSEVLEGNAWIPSTIQILPFNIYAHCMLFVNDTTIMIIGGFQDYKNMGSKTLYLNNFQGPWIPGPTLLTGRKGPSCGRIINKKGGQQTSIIAVGGIDNSDLSMDTVEILHDNSGSWMLGPSLPIGIGAAAMVNDPQGGIVLLGGMNRLSMLKNLNLVQEIYRLSDAGPTAKWQVMAQKLTTPRFWPTAFLIPDELVDCN